MNKPYIRGKKNSTLKGGVSSLDRKFIIRAGVHTLATMALNVMRKGDNLNRPKVLPQSGFLDMYPSLPGTESPAHETSPSP